MKRTEGADWLMWKINVDMPLALTEIDLVINGTLHAYSTKSFHQTCYNNMVSICRLVRIK